MKSAFYAIRILGSQRFLKGLVCAFFCLGSFGCSPYQDAHLPVRKPLMDTHTRLVWLQDAWELNDVFSKMGRLRLMGWDSLDGRGERVILPGPMSYQKPLITPCGERIVLTYAGNESVWSVNWDGSGPRQLASGMALALWRDPESGVTWIYTARDRTEDGGIAYAKLVRFDLDNPDNEQHVWDRTPVGRDNLQLSGDGSRASGMFPWPHCGVAALAEGAWDRHGRGCWPIMAPDNRYLMGFLDGAHRTITLVDTRHDRRWSVPLANAPGIEGHEIYHPRWSNHPRFMVMTGPYKIRHGGNNIRGGGDAVEVHLGRFSADYTGVEAWMQITSNEYANFFPDIWIADGEQAALEVAIETVEPGQPDVPDEGDAGEILLSAFMTEASTFPSPKDIAPYTGGLVANSYRVQSIEEGELPHEEILVAHWAIRDSAELPEARREPGNLYTMRIQDYSRRPELEGERLTMDVEDILLPLYYEIGDSEALE